MKGFPVSYFHFERYFLAARYYEKS